MLAMTNSERTALSPPDFCLDHCNMSLSRNHPYTTPVREVLDNGARLSIMRPLITFAGGEDDEASSGTVEYPGKLFGAHGPPGAGGRTRRHAAIRLHFRVSRRLREKCSPDRGAGQHRMGPYWVLRDQTSQGQRDLRH